MSALLTENTSTKPFTKPNIFKYVLGMTAVVAGVLFVWLFGWPLFQRLRNNRDVEPESLTTTVREVLTQPRTAVLGTSFSIKTIATKGPQGDKGDQGDRGAQGERGQDGPEGQRGPAGEQGIQGETGAAGAAGVKGDTGAKGDKGDTGDSGSGGGGTGPQGPAGPAGPTGATGATGPTGPAGANGTNGTNGVDGTDGVDGTNGIDGTDGADGAVGPQGPPGPTDPNVVFHTGNSFGEEMVVGTNDTFNLAFETDGTERAFLDTLGNFTVNDGDVFVNGGAGFGDIAAVDTTTSLVSALATGANAITGGSYTVSRATAEYTPDGNGGSEFLNIFRAQSTINAGDGTALNAQRGFGSFLTNNSSGLVMNMESFRGTVTNNGTTESRGGSFINTFTNNGTVNGADAKTASFDFVNTSAGSVAEHYGLSTTVDNTGAFTGSMTGFTASLVNGSTGSVASNQIGSRMILANEGSVGGMVGSFLSIRNENGGATNDIIGQLIEAGNYDSSNAANLYWLRAGLDSLETPNDVSGSHYGIYLDTVASGGTNNYGLYISGAEGGSGTNASLWVNNGLSRFAAATNGAASVNIASSGGADVSSPNTGDLWWNGTNLYFYNGTTSVDLLAAGAGFVNGGNAFGVGAVLGTTDAQDLSLMVNGNSDVFDIAYDGAFYNISSTSDSLTIDSNIINITADAQFAVRSASDGTIVQIIASDPLPQALLGLEVGDSTLVGPYRLLNFADSVGVEVGSISYSELTTSYNTTSDQRLKNNIVDTSLTLEDLMKIKIHDYTWKGNTNGKTSYGVLAQELYEIFPNAVTLPRSDDQYWSVDYSKLVPLTIKSIQDQQLSLTEMKEKVDLLAELGQISSLAKWSFNSWEFIVNVTFKGPVSFLNNVTFNKRVLFADKDMGGSVVIPAGQQHVEVKFETPYEQTPIITVTPQGQAVVVAVDQVSPAGFKVILSSALGQPLTVNWTALAVTTASVVPTSSPSPTATPTASPASTPEQTPSPVLPSPTVFPVPTATPAEVVQPSVEPEPTVQPSPTPSAVPSASVEPTTTPSPQPSSSPVE